MHDLLFSHQDALSTEDLIGYARGVGLDVELFAEKLRRRKYTASRPRRRKRRAERRHRAPTFFANGRRHPGAFDLQHAHCPGAVGTRPYEGIGTILVTREPGRPGRELWLVRLSWCR